MLLQSLSKHRIGALAVAALMAAMALLLAQPAATFAQQPPPHAFPGSATIDGVVAPDGTVITAWIDGQQVASATVSDGKYSLMVEQPSGLSFAGKTITFKVGGLAASKTAAWEQGGATLLDLTAFSSANKGPASPENTTTTANTTASTTNTTSTNSTASTSSTTTASATTSTTNTAPAAQTVERRGLFGQITGVDGETLLVQTAQGEVRIQVTASTRVRTRRGELVGPEAIQPGQRIAAVVTLEADQRTAEQILLLPQRGSGAPTTTVHVTGVVTETDQGTTVIVTDDGRRFQLEFGLNGRIPASGTVVTIVGQRNAEDEAVLRVRAAHHLDRTLERLTDHVAQIQDIVADTNGQIQHLGRVQRILERTSQRQLEILERVSQHLPEESRPDLERALQNLQDANRTVVRAFNQALELNARKDRDSGQDNGASARLLVQVEPSLADLAEILGIPEDTLLERLGQGSTLLQIAEEAGFTRESLVEAVLARVRQRLQRLIEAGEITRQEADRMIEKIKREAAEHLGRAVVDVRVNLPGVPFSLADIAGLLGLEPPVLLARLHRGETLVEIARQSGRSREQLIDAIMGLARRHAQQLVDQGAMRQEDMDRFLAHFREEVEERIDEVAFRSDGQDRDSAITPEDVAAAVGVPVYEFMAYVERGGTLEQLAKRQGQNVQDVLDRLYSHAEERLNRLVAEGRISPEQAREILARLKEQFREETDRPDGLSVIVSGSATAAVEFSGFPFDPAAVAEALGITPQELRQRLAQGETLEQLARAKGVALERLAEILVAEMEAKLQRMVRSGQLTEERARQMLAQARESILKMLREFRLRVGAEVRAEARRDEAGAPGPFFRPYADIPLTMEDTARVLGVSYEDVRGADGKDIRALLAERGSTPEKFAADLQALVRARLKAQVDRGEVTEERVGRLLEELKERVLQDLLGHRLEAAAQRTPGSAGASAQAGVSVSTVAPFNLRLLADALDVPPEEIPALLAQGQSLPEIAARAGVSLDGLVEVSIDPLRARLEKLAKEGYLHEDQIREKLEQARRSTLQAIEEYRVPGRLDGEGSAPGAREGRLSEPGVRRDLPRDQRPADEMPEMTLEEVRRLLDQGLTSARITAIVDASLDEQVRAGRVSREEAQTRREIARQLIDRALAERPLPPTSSEGRPVERRPVEGTAPTTTGSREQPTSPTTRQVDPASVLPTLASADDVFQLLGVGAEATALRQRGLALSRVAEQLGFSQESMRLRLRAAAEARVNASVRAGVLTSARASELLAAFDRQSAEWVQVIFRAEVSTQITTSATSGVTRDR